MLFKETDWDSYPSLPMSARWLDLVTFFQADQATTFCAITDADQFPIGLITLQKYQQLIASPFGHALNQRKGVLELMDQDFLSARLSDNAETAFAGLTDTAQLLNSGLVLLDDDGKYAGGLNAKSVFKCLNQIHANVLASLQAQIVERQEIEQQIRNLADTDPLTEILNRRAFVREIDALVAKDQKFVCAFIDLDRFKPLNDRYGHAVGDQVLTEISARLQRLPMCSLSARLGGDEFAFVVFFDTTTSAIETIEQIHNVITDAVATDVGDVAVGASIGIAAFPADASDKTKLMHAADKAMMRCKANGGGVCPFDRKRDHFGLDVEAFELSVGNAVRQNLFRPALQPIIELKTGQIVGYEVLARWPNSGFAADPSPVQFIPVIERLGMMDHFFVSLLRQALTGRAADNIFFAFNVSPSQLSHSRFANILLSELDALGVPGNMIELEVTEHVLFRNIDRSKDVLQRLTARGVKLSLDDFGTGYSALSLLGELPFSKVKLDKSLLGQDTDNTGLPKVLTASLHLCKELDLVTCTEGIETARQAELLAAQSCDQVQGYYFGRPALIEPRTTDPLRPARAKSA
ncbi:MAG: EAL domain-containing protein [Pseudomonadota bacterium]